MCDRIKYLVSEKSGINHNFWKIRIDLDNSLSIGKMVTFHNLIIFANSIVNENEDNYYYNILSEKGSNKDKSDTRYF